MKKTSLILSKIAYTIAGLILLFLTFESLRYSYHFDLHDLAHSTLYVVKDSFLLTFFLVVFVLGLFFLLSKLAFKGCADEASKKKRLNIISIVVSCLVFLGLLIWVLSTLIPPYWDQMQVYLDAKSFNKGDYSDMNLAYLSMYPQQYGLIFFESLLLKIGNHYGFLQGINALLVALTVFFGTKLAVEISDSTDVGFYTLTLLGTCFPLYYYVSFVYGDVFFIFSSLLVAWLSVKFLKTNKWGYILGALFTTLIMLPVRENSLIFLISLAILFVIYSMKNKKWQLLLIAPLFLLLPMLSNKAIEGYYNKKGDTDINAREMPAINWIVMGLQGDPYTDDLVGYYNGYNLGAWNACLGDKEATTAMSKEYLDELLGNFKAHPDFAMAFFKAKANEQWLDPFFEAPQMTFNEDVDYNSVKLFYNSKILSVFRFYMNIINTAVYLMALVYIAYLLRHSHDFYSLVLAVGFIGGFLFSLIWEAKGRYTFPFFVMLLPLAGYGIAKTIEAVRRISSS